MDEAIVVGLVTVLAVISPGQDFAMVARNIYIYGRKIGLASAIGIAAGVQVHVFYTMFGMNLLAEYASSILNVVKFLGAGYLIYIGWKTFFDKDRMELILASGYSVSSLSALKIGFLTNALNPKTTVFVISVYSQVIKASTQAATQFAYGLFMSASHWIWFSAVAILISQNSLRRRLLDRQGVVDRVIGAVLIGLGASLAFGNLGS